MTTATAATPDRPDRHDAMADAAAELERFLALEQDLAARRLADAERAQARRRVRPALPRHRW